jgi:hypothetical protein
MDDKENDPDFQPPHSKKKKCAVQFKTPKTDQEMTVLLKSFVPKNTQRANVWALNMFKEWELKETKRVTRCAQKIF